MNKNPVRFDAAFVLSVIIFLIADSLFIVYREFYLYGLNTNTISMINIAQKYMRGEFVDAINGAFAPLCSWVLIPFLAAGISPVFSVYLVNMVLGCLLLLGIRMLSFRFDISDRLRTVLTYILVPVVLQFTLRDHIPDILVTVVLVYYLFIVFDAEYLTRARNGFKAGLICSVGYLGKAYVFPFFLAHFICINALDYFLNRGKRSEIIKSAMPGLLIFTLISGLWIAVLSVKYDTITIATSGEYNHRVMGPDVKSPSTYSTWGFDGWRNYIRQGHPVYNQDFFAPPNESAISIWEDFTYLTPYLKPWSVLDSKENLKYQIKHILRNIYYTVGILEGSFSVFSSIIIVGFCLLYLVPFNRQTLNNFGVPVLVTIAIYMGGYILLHPDERYSWIVYILLLLMGAHLMTRMYRHDFFIRSRQNILVFFFIVSFLMIPVRNIMGVSNDDAGLWKLGNMLRKHVKIEGSKVASNKKFSETLKMLFYTGLNVSYYGQAGFDINDEQLQKELAKYDIDYYLIWMETEGKGISGFLSQYREITTGETSEKDVSMPIKIYSLKEKI